MFIEWKRMDVYRECGAPHVVRGWWYMGYGCIRGWWYMGNRGIRGSRLMGNR